MVSVNSELKEVDELDTSSQDSDTVGTSSCGMMSGNQRCLGTMGVCKERTERSG